MLIENHVIWITSGHDYLILVDLPSEPFYILGCLADLGCQTSRVSHLRVFFVNVFHLPQGLAEQRRERVREEQERMRESDFQ